MKRTIKARLWIALASGVLSLAATAVPSGFAPLPKVKLPRVNGRTLPVHLWPDSRDAKTVWVEPLEGEFVSEGVVKSPAANCDVLAESLKLDEYVAKMRLHAAQQLHRAQVDYDKKLSESRPFVKTVGRLQTLVPVYVAELGKLKTTKIEVVAEMTKLKGELESLDTLIATQRDKDQVGALKARAANTENQLTSRTREFLGLQNSIREKESALTQMQVELAEAKGELEAVELEMTTIGKRIADNKAAIESVDKEADAAMKKFSRRIGAYATFTAEFAPARFLDALQKSNPDLVFRYVPSITATVEATIPGNIAPGSALEGESGTLILASKLSDPREARLRDYVKFFEQMKNLPQELLKSGDVKAPIPNPVKQVQEKLDESRIAQLESSLSGVKFLALKLSVLGYCALKEPHALSGELIGDAKDTFKLALYYTYPVNYAIKVHGEFSSSATLYDFYKMTKSSSWFGLSKSQKQEHVQRLSNSQSVNVQVEPLGVALNAGESLLLTEKVKDQLVYFALQPYLDTKGGTPLTMKFDDGPLGAESVGKRLMLIPNPWTFWGGLVLTSLSEMFGSSEQIATTEVSKTSMEKIDYLSGFSFLLSGDITVGDLKRAKTEETREIR